MLRMNAFSDWRMKKVMVTVASAEKDTIGRRTMPNHLRKRRRKGVVSKQDNILANVFFLNALLFDVAPFAHEFYAVNELRGKEVCMKEWKGNGWVDAQTRP